MAWVEIGDEQIMAVWAGLILHETGPRLLRTAFEGSAFELASATKGALSSLAEAHLNRKKYDGQDCLSRCVPARDCRKKRGQSKLGGNGFPQA
jgi:hypothetical protein